MLAALNGWTVREASAPRYDPDVMRGVAIWRELTPVPCMVSSPIVGISEWVYVYGKNTGALRYCKVVDTSETRHRAGHLLRKRFVEVSFENALLFCGHLKERPESCPVIVISEY
jgi:hypothetical protein